MELHSANTRSKQVFFWLSFLGGMLWCLYRLLNNTGWILDDEPTHWYFSCSVWHSFDNLFNGWTRFGRNLLHAPVAALGFTATRVWTLILAGLAVWLTARTGKNLGLKSVWAVPILLIFQEWFPDLSYSVLTQTPMMLVWILGMYWATKKQYIGASICFGYLSLIRHEGILLTGLWGLWVTCQQGGFVHTLWKKPKELSALRAFFSDLALAGFTLLPIFIYNLGAFIVKKEIPFAVYFEPKPTDHYGSGEIWWYAMLLFTWLGTFSFFSALVGCCLLKKKEWSLWSLLFLSYGGYFLAHTLIFWKGLYASGGYYHFIMPMAPLFALLAVRLIDVLMLKKWSRYLTFFLLFFIVYQGLALRTHQMYAQDWHAIMAKKAEPKHRIIAAPISASESRQHLNAATDLALKLRSSKHTVVSNFAMSSARLGQFATPKNNRLLYTETKDLPVGTLFVWDQQMSELGTLHTFEQFPAEQWKKHKVWKRRYPLDFRIKENAERIYTAAVFEKIK